MTMITSQSGNQGQQDSGPGPSLRSGAGVPGTLTAVPSADHSQTPQKGASVTYPGPPRPARISATPSRNSPTNWAPP